MLLQFLIPLVIVLTLSAIACVCARRHRQNSKAADTFVLSPVLGYLLIACGLVISAVPLLPGAEGKIPVAKYLLNLTPWSLAAVAIAAWYFRYRVVLTEETMVAGAIRPRTILFSDVVDWGVIKRGGTELIMYLRNGQTLRCSGLLIDFDELVGEVASHMAGLPAEQPGRSERFQNRAKRAQSNRALGWVLFVGFALITLLLIIVLKLQ
jgi:hypothetical protein